MLLELTFIVLARPLEPPPSDAELTSENIEALPVIRDVDLFRNSREDPEFEVECEVMIKPVGAPPPSYYQPTFLINAHLLLPPPAQPVYCGQHAKHCVVCEPWLRTVSVFDQVEMRVTDRVAQISELASGACARVSLMLVQYCTVLVRDMSTMTLRIQISRTWIRR